MFATVCYAGVTAADKTLIVDWHNTLRGTVENTGQPAATDMQKMVSHLRVQ